MQPASFTTIFGNLLKPRPTSKCLYAIKSTLECCPSVQHLGLMESSELSCPLNRTLESAVGLMTEVIRGYILLLSVSSIKMAEATFIVGDEFDLGILRHVYFG